MLRLFLLTAAVGLCVGLDVHAQGGGGGFGGGGTGGTGGGFGGGTGGSSLGGSSLGGSSLGGTSLGGSSLGNGLGGTGGRTTGGTGTRGGSSGGVSNTNFLSGSYGNVLYPGRPGSTSTSMSSGTVGGFGQATLTNNSNSGNSGRNAGGSASVTGLTNNNNSNTVIRIQHTTTLDFPVKPVVASELQQNLQSIIARSSSIKDPSKIKVAIEGNTVVLSGPVASERELKLVEGMIRLTPGVRAIRNELQAAP